MATKIPGINQHIVLHELYPNDCCLCKAEVRIAELERKVRELEQVRDANEICEERR